MKTLEQRALELTKKFKGKYWKFYDEETKTIFQWDGDKYVLEFNDKQL